MLAAIWRRLWDGLDRLVYRTGIAERIADDSDDGDSTAVTEGKAGADTPTLRHQDDRSVNG